MSYEMCQRTTDAPPLFPKDESSWLIHRAVHNRREIPKLHTNPVALLREEFLAQPVLLLLPPLLRQELLDRRVSAEEGAAVAPDGGRGVRLGHFGGVPRVPEGLGGLDLFAGGFEREGRLVLRHDVLINLFLMVRGTRAGGGGESSGRSGDLFEGRRMCSDVGVNWHHGSRPFVFSCSSLFVF